MNCPNNNISKRLSQKAAIKGYYNGRGFATDTVGYANITRSYENQKGNGRAAVPPLFTDYRLVKGS